MLFFRGTRTARIKTYHDHEHQCNDCKDFDLKVKVYKDYYHFCFIPAFPTGVKTVRIRCNKCTEPYRSDSLQKQYELRTRNPFWLYTWLLVIALALLGGVGAALLDNYLDRNYASNPKVGDVYSFREAHQPFGEFYKVVRINGDSVMTLGNNVRYVFDASALDSSDYFVAGKEILFSKKDLPVMLDSGVITAVSRHYGATSGFDRVK